MPFKANAARRHCIPGVHYRVINWPVYEARLRQRGDLSVELVLTLRLVFHLALRQAERLARSVLALLGSELRVPDHTTLSRRGAAGRAG